MTLYCNYCKEAIDGKGYKADSKRYHIKCLRVFKKEIDKQKQMGKIKPGEENTVPVPNQDKFINSGSLK